MLKPRVARARDEFYFLCILDKTAHHAPQGMERRGGSKRMVAGHSWSATSSCAVAVCEGPVEACSEAISEGWSATRCSTSADGVARASEESLLPRCAQWPPRKSARIRVAITSLGPDDIEDRASLEAALARAEHLAAIPPVDKRIADAEAFIIRAKKLIEAESVKIMEAEKQKQIFEQELAQAEKDLIGFRQEAEMQGSGSVAQIDPVSSLDAELWRVGAELVQLRGVGQETDLPCGPSVKRVCRTRGACSDSTHANSGSSRAECMVGRTSFRIARRIVARRQHSCSGIEHQVVGRSRAYCRDDGGDDQLSALPPPWRGWCKIWSSGRTRWRGFEPRTTFAQEISPGNELNTCR